MTQKSKVSSHSNFRFILNPHIQSKYKDRAAERRQLYPHFNPYSSSSSIISETETETETEDAQLTSKRMKLQHFLGRGHHRTNPLIEAVGNVQSQRPIGEENVGNRLLRKMGWVTGQSLGKQRTYNNNERKPLLEPLQVKHNIGTRGLGFHQ
jgi:hypothetical protein